MDSYPRANSILLESYPRAYPGERLPKSSSWWKVTEELILLDSYPKAHPGRQIPNSSYRWTVTEELILLDN